jgi:hypothetical protein
LPIISDAVEVQGHFLKEGTYVVPSPIVEPKERKNTTVTYESIQPDTIPHNFGLVGPTGEGIHNFLYPTLNDGKVVILN